MDKLLAERAIQLISADFVSRPEIAHACKSVVNYLASQPEQNLRHLTFGDIFRVVTQSTGQDLTSTAIAYLSGDRACVLDMRFEFIDGDDIFEVSAEELKDAQNTKVFIHPDLGTAVDDFEKYVFVYFVPSGIRNEGE
jgi:hypothetical protein